MKTVGKRSYFLFLLIAVFAVGMIIFLVRFFISGNTWASQPYNAHLEAEEGTILDSKKNLICEGSEDGTIYADDELVRKAMLHTIGDTEGNISTGIRSTYRAQLSGYNIFTGLSSNASTVKLTMDSDVCAHAYELLEGYSGCAFIYNYKTGQVLCKVSAPSLDPLSMPDDIEDDPSYEGVFLDRTISSSFTPGSTFKVITSICAMENMPDWEDFTSWCEGSVTIGDSEINCMDEHGEIGLRDGLKYSCNVFFAELADALGAEALQNTANELGFEEDFTFEGADVKKSHFDLSDASENEIAWSGIGQYTDLVTPYHMAVIMGSIANGGQSAKPYMVSSVVNSIGIPVKLSVRTKLPSLLDSGIAKTMKTCLRENVKDYYGDDFFPEGMKICAKTGTAEVGNGKDDTAWIAGFSANPKTPYAFVVTVEEGGFGLSTAGSIASDILSLLNE